MLVCVNAGCNCLYCGMVFVVGVCVCQAVCLAGLDLGVLR